MNGHKGIDNVALLVASIDDLIFPDDYFNFIFTTQLIEHLTEPEVEQGFREVCRCLGSSGIFMVTTRNNENIRVNVAVCPDCGAVFNRFQHLQNWDAEKLSNLMESVGFEVLECKPTRCSNSVPFESNLLIRLAKPLIKRIYESKFASKEYLVAVGIKR